MCLVLILARTVIVLNRQRYCKPEKAGDAEEKEGLTGEGGGKKGDIARI